MAQSGSHAFLRQKLSIDFITLKHACPKGIYVAPVPNRPLLWTGVIFVRKGPYANALLRFDINFPEAYPERPPVVTFTTDVFHPLVAPLTTYTHTARDRGSDTVSAADEQKLPPGGLSLRHGFREWYDGLSEDEIYTATNEDVQKRQGGTHQVEDVAKAVEDGNTADADRDTPSKPEITSEHSRSQPPHVIEVLQYMRIIFDTEALLDSVPLDAAANPGAWHAWRSYRTPASTSKTASPSRKSLDLPNDSDRARSMSPNKQQPGGARRPGEWNWTGVWQDRVRKAIQASVSETTLFGGDESKVIDFMQLNDETYGRLSPVVAARTSSQLEQDNQIEVVPTAT